MLLNICVKYLNYCFSMAVIRQCPSYNSVTVLVSVHGHHLGHLKQRPSECDNPATCQTVLPNIHMWCNAYTVYLMSIGLIFKVKTF
jgi:hypothetical protein